MTQNREYEPHRPLRNSEDFKDRRINTNENYNVDMLQKTNTTF
jgi:hypothetical protein